MANSDYGRYATMVLCENPLEIPPTFFFVTYFFANGMLDLFLAIKGLNYQLIPCRNYFLRTSGRLILSCQQLFCDF